MPRAEQNQLPCPVGCWRHPQSILRAVCVQTKESHVGRGSGEKANPEANNKLCFPSVKHSVIWALQYAPPRKTGSSWVGMPRDTLVFKDLPNIHWYLELQSQWSINNAIGLTGPASPMPSNPHGPLAMPPQGHFSCLALPAHLGLLSICSLPPKARLMDCVNPWLM